MRMLRRWLRDANVADAALALSGFAVIVMLLAQADLGRRMVYPATWRHDGGRPAAHANFAGPHA